MKPEKRIAWAGSWLDLFWVMGSATGIGFLIGFVLAYWMASNGIPWWGWWE